MVPPVPKAASESGSMLPPGATSNLPRVTGSTSAQDLYDTEEHVPELAWPTGLAVYDRMVRSDGKIKALENSQNLPIMRRRYELDPAGAADEDVKLIAEDIGVPILGSDDPAPVRGRGRFHHGEHLEQALLARRYGSYWFEIVGRIEDRKWRLQKLSPRPTRTLDSVQVSDSGGLVSITQVARDGRRKIVMPVPRIVGYVWQREGANWYGQSTLRPAYRAWFLKDQLIRADACGKRRNSMGVPVFNPGADASQEVLDAYERIGRKLHSGQEVSITLHAPDAEFALVGVTGSTADALESARYHDEDAASAFLAMWMQLGQSQHGSRALGDTMLDVFNAGLDAIADWYCGTFTEYVIARWMEFNYGPDHGRAVPKLVSTRVESPELAVSDLVTAIEKGLVVADKSLRAAFRANYNLPDADDPDLEPPAPPAAPVFAQRHEHDHVHCAALDDGPTSRQRWRELTSREVAAAIDPESMDQRWRDSAARIVAQWPELRDEQIAAVVREILDANGDATRLARLYVPTVGVDLIREEMLSIARASAADAVREAAAQGALIKDHDLTVTEARLAARAEGTAMLIAQNLASSASGQALRLSGGGKTSEEVATQVATELRKLSDSGLAKQVVGALTDAQNQARADVIKQGPEPKSIVATEIMDGNTCPPCADVDGTEYASIEEAEADYPDAGYQFCEGYDACRGFLFAEYE